MSNEQFNAMDANKLGKELLTDYQQIIPSLEQAVRASSDFQQMVIQELIKIIPNFVDQLLGGQGDSSTSPPGGFKPPPGVASFITPIIPGNLGALNQAQATFNPPVIPKANAVEKFASKWLNPQTGIANYNSMSQAEAKYLLGQISKGNLNKFKIFRAGLIKHMDSLNVKPPTAAQISAKINIGIKSAFKSGSTVTVVQKIALLYEDIQNSIRLKHQRITILNKIKTYNRFVQLNRKAQLTIDTAFFFSTGGIRAKN